jgi:hypothetical protein
MNKETTTVHALKTVEACAMIRKAKSGVKFHLHLRFDLKIEGDPGNVYSGAGGGYVTISRKEALRIVKEMISERLEEKGARVSLTVRSSTCEILGTRTRYWIG